jgi:hypothetical protein
METWGLRNSELVTNTGCAPVSVAILAGDMRLATALCEGNTLGGTHLGQRYAKRHSRSLMCGCSMTIAVTDDMLIAHLLLSAVTLKCQGRHVTAAII